MKKIRGKLTRRALNQLVSIFLVKVKRMQFNNISDKTPVKFIILMKGTKTGFIMGWCKCSRKFCIHSFASDLCCCVLIILFFLSTEIWLSLLRIVSYHIFSGIDKIQFIIRHALRLLFLQRFYEIIYIRWCIHVTQTVIESLPAFRLPLIFFFFFFLQ